MAALLSWLRGRRARAKQGPCVPREGGWLVLLVGLVSPREQRGSGSRDKRVDPGMSTGLNLQTVKVWGDATSWMRAHD